jgi:hypothetical protein
MNRILLFPDAAEATGSKTVATVAQDRAQAIKEYYDAATREAKAAVVTKYPFLKEVFSPGNHS